MIVYYKTLGRTDKILFWLAMLVIATGVFLRIAVWLQNRNLIIDEANIARNLYERDYLSLAQPLSYEQYAPIFFLWMEKTFSLLFGFSELALKAYPLLCGIAVLFVFMLVLKEFVSLRSLWYPLVMLATAHFLIRYSTELKQYMGDALVVLLLIYAALKISITGRSSKKFTLQWMLIGTLAIFSAMPSVFALTGVGAYYFWTCIKQKRYDKLKPVFFLAIFWLAEFGVYYYFLLRDQAHSTYLQNFHANYFLVATPGSKKEWLHNWYVTSELVKLPTGYSTFAKIFNFALLLLGALRLLYKRTAAGLLVLLPLFFTLVAGAINEYSMIPRVVLFTMPLFLLAIAYGLDYFMSARPLPVRAVFALAAFACFILGNSISMAWKPFYSEQITWGMKLMKDYALPGDQVNISHGSGPAFIYYTQIHPGRQEWSPIANAPIRPWDADWKKIGEAASGKAGAIFSTIPRTEAAQHRAELSSAARIAASIEDSTAKCYAYVLEK